MKRGKWNGIPTRRQLIIRCMDLVTSDVGPTKYPPCTSYYLVVVVVVVVVEGAGLEVGMKISKRERIMGRSLSLHPA